MKIPLTKGKYALVDKADFLILSKSKWCSNGATSDYAVRRGKDGSRIYMHREITKCKKGMSVDHINGNTLDNRRKNLRICTHAKNRQNSKVYTTNTSGFTGVVWHKQAGKWNARIRVNYKNISLGNFDDLRDAVNARKEKESQIGWLTRINTIQC